MAVSKLMLEGIDEEAFYLCAIHSSLPSFKMAFLLNKHLNLQLQRFSTDIEVIHSKATEVYPCYIFEDESNYTTYTLFKNKCTVEQKVYQKNSMTLFGEQSVQKTVKNLVPEFKKVDYFLKIDTDNPNYQSKILVSGILEINHVITAFTVDYHQIKSKNNLIIT